MRSRLVPASFATALAFLALAPTAEAHSIPRLYAALAPSAAYDPLQARALFGGAFLMGLGVDPERDALILRVDLYAGYGREPRGQQPLFGVGAAILYRQVLRASHDVVWTWALGPGVIAVGSDDVGAATFGARAELSVRIWGNLAFTAFALSGPTVGTDVRIPWGTPMGLAIELGAP
jgi:hypothetical protein